MGGLSGATMTFALAMAFQRGWADGRAKVGTEYVLEELIRRLDPLHLGPGPDRRLLRQHLSSRQSWSSTEDTPAAASVANDMSMEVAACLREAQWVARRRLKRRLGDAEPDWTPSVRAAARQALRDAVAAGSEYAQWTHLLVSVLTDRSTLVADLMHSLAAQRDQDWAVRALRRRRVALVRE